MEYRKMGRSDLKLSEISLGCWVMGGDYWGGAEDSESVASIRKALDCGVNLIDTAVVYGKGRSEEIVGKALKGRRKESIISTKLWKTDMHYSDTFTACDASLKRLQTDYIDIFFIHYPNDEIPIEETMKALLELKKQGKIREIGLSNFNRPQMEEALKYGRFEVIQPCYNLLWRFIENDDLPFCQENEIGVIPYSPIAQGILTGKFSRDTIFKEDDGRRRVPLFQKDWYEKCLDVADTLKKPAANHSKTQGQVAINWVTSQPGITSAIVGARNAAQMEENAGGAGWRLEASELAELDKAGRTVTDFLPKYETFFSTKIIR